MHAKTNYAKLSNRHSHIFTSLSKNANNFVLHNFVEMWNSFKILTLLERKILDGEFLNIKTITLYGSKVLEGLILPNSLILVSIVLTNVAPELQSLNSFRRNFNQKLDSLLQFHEPMRTAEIIKTWLHRIHLNGTFKDFFRQHLRLKEK